MNDVATDVSTTGGSLTMADVPSQPELPPSTPVETPPSSPSETPVSTPDELPQPDPSPMPGDAPPPQALLAKPIMLRE